MYYYPPEPESECAAKLIVCRNTNICGRRNPTHLPGFGWADEAVQCLSVLGPPGLELQRGPCFIRCSRGVTAQLVGNDGTIRSRPLFRLNSVKAVAQVLADELEHEVAEELAAAYTSPMDPASARAGLKGGCDVRNIKF